LLIWPVRIWAPNLDWDPRHSKIDAWCCNTDFGQQRAEVLRKLSGMRGKHLAVVRYAQNKYSGLEWVYNAPDIDASQVVWARDMGWQQNQRLREYYSGRTAWLVEPDTHPVRVRPYEVAEQEEGGGVRRTTH
jgi:hypothetical protein